jgi:Uma2 family endonuclease
MTGTVHPARPRLETGDRLTRAEFHARYCARPDIKRAELVGGIVHVASPERFNVHGDQQTMVVVWLGAYAARTPGVKSGISASIFVDDESEVQPDAFLFRQPPPDPGAAQVRPDHYLEGTPQLMVEVAANSARYDLTDKLALYQRAGVRKYIVWVVLAGRIHWFHLRGGAYARLEPDERGVIESEEFPGLRLHVANMLAGDLAGVLDEL